MDLKHCREWTISGGLIEPGQPLLAPSTLVHNVFDHELERTIRMGGSPRGAFLSAYRRRQEGSAYHAGAGLQQ